MDTQQQPSGTEKRQTVTASIALRVLVMDDDPVLCDMFSRALRRAGHKVYQALTLDEARHLLNNNRFDVFMCDMQMGAERSFGLLQEYRARLVENLTSTIVVSAEEQYRGR